MEGLSHKERKLGEEMRDEYIPRKPHPKFVEDTAFDIGLRGEKRLKKALRGTSMLTPGSGKGRTKGDMLHGKANTPLVHGFRRMIEKKTTTMKSMKLEQSWLEKIEKQAFDAGKEPVLVIEFENAGRGTSMWGMVPLEKLNALFELEDAE